MKYSKLDSEELSVEEEEEDMEIVIKKVGQDFIPNTVTLYVVRHYTKKDNLLSGTMENISWERLRSKYQEMCYKVLFEEL